MLRNLEGWHFVVLLIVILLLFGSKKLPEAARGLGRSMRIFKSEMKTMQDDDKPEPASGSAATGSDADPTADSTADQAGRETHKTSPETPPRVDG